MLTARGVTSYDPWDKARFNPNLEVMNANGETLFRQGDHVIGACLAGDGEEGPRPLLRIRGSDVVKEVEVRPSQT